MGSSGSQEAVWCGRCLGGPSLFSHPFVVFARFRVQKFDDLKTCSCPSQSLLPIEKGHTLARLGKMLRVSRISLGFVLDDESAFSHL